MENTIFNEMCEILSSVNDILLKGKIKQIEINDTTFLLFESGRALRKIKKFDHKNVFYAYGMKEVPNTPCKLHGGRNYIKCCNNKFVFRDRLIAKAFINDNLNDKHQIIHIDGDNLNNRADNLSIINNQQRSFMKQSAKGYTFRKEINKYQAEITLNNVKINLGCFNTEAEAHEAYLNAKSFHHVV